MPSKGSGGSFAQATGVLGEALAVAHLVRAGYEVFIGFGNTSCDFVALRGGRAFRVEVKATIRPSRLRADGARVYNRPHWHAGRCDMLLWVLPELGLVLEDPTQPFYVAE